MKGWNPHHTRIHVSLSLNLCSTSLSTASGAEKLLLVFVGLCLFVFAHPTAL